MYGLHSAQAQKKEAKIMRLCWLSKIYENGFWHTWGTVTRFLFSLLRLFWFWLWHYSLSLSGHVNFLKNILLYMQLLCIWQRNTRFFISSRVAKDWGWDLHQNLNNWPGWKFEKLSKWGLNLDNLASNLRFKALKRVRLLRVAQLCLYIISKELSLILQCVKMTS